MPIFVCCGLICFHCTTKVQTPTEVLVNPVDPKSPVFTLPVTTIMAAPNPSISLPIPIATIIVQGNVDAVKFSFKLDNYDWSPWDPSTTIILTDLDDGVHHCIIRALHRDLTTIELQPPSVDFTVRAITGPALRFSSRKIVATVGSDFNYFIVADEVQNLYGVKLVFTYDKTLVRINSISSGTISHVEIRLFEMQYENKVRAEMFFTGNTAIQGISGTDTIVAIYCSPLKKGESAFIFITDSVQFRDASNTAIPVNQIVNGKVVVE